MKYTQESYLAKCKEIHGDKFDYSETVFENKQSLLKIYCNLHKDYFYQKAINHIRVKGCPICESNNRSTTLSDSERESQKNKFIEKAKSIHGDKYNYDSVEYVNVDTHVKIWCNYHNEFFKQKPANHINLKQGCKKCAVLKNNLTTEEFISRSKKIHGDKYGYDSVTYINMKTPVKIWCTRHNEYFEQTPRSHLDGVIYREFDLTRDEFILKATKFNKGMFDYSEIIYIDMDTPITFKDTVTGKLHTQKPKWHLNKYNQDYYYRNRNKVVKIKPPKNIKEKTIKPKTKTIDEKRQEVINKIIEIHKDKFIYENSKISNKKVTVTCPIHGDIKVVTQTILNNPNYSCPECKKENIIENFKIKIDNAFGKGKYLYDKLNYINIRNNVTLFCTGHNDYITVDPDNFHLSRGCKVCNPLTLGEQEISKLLNMYNIEYVNEKTFPGCKDKSLLRFDFYLPKYNVIIEFDGEQHFKIVEHFGGLEYLQGTQQRDQIKNEYCLTNNIPLLRIRYDEDVEEKLTEFLKQQNII